MFFGLFLEDECGKIGKEHVFVKEIYTVDLAYSSLLVNEIGTQDMGETRAVSTFLVLQDKLSVTTQYRVEVLRRTSG